MSASRRREGSRIGFRPASRAALEIPQTSLADVAFLLLIFFVSTATFVLHRALPLRLPSASQTSVTVSADEVLRVSVQTEGELLVDGKPCSAEELTTRARERLDALPSLVVSVEAAEGSRYGSLVAVIDALEGAGARRVHFRTRPGEG